MCIQLRSQQKPLQLHRVKTANMNIYCILYSYTSTSWRWRGLKKVPRRDLDQLIQRAFLPTCAGTILHTIYTLLILYTCSVHMFYADLHPFLKEKLRNLYHTSRFVSMFTLGSDRNFGSVRGSADFGRFGPAKILPNFLSFNFTLTYNIRV